MLHSTPLDYIKITGPVVGPRLIIERSGTNALLRWPTNTATVPVLEITTVLSSNWTAYATNPPVVGTNYQVTNAISGTKFFRLAFSSGQGFSLFSRTPKPASEDSGGNYPFTAAAVLPPNTFYTNTFIDVSDFNESWRYYYNGGEFDGLWENQGFTAWDSHNGGTNFYSSRYEEPPGTLIDEQQFPLALSPESFSGLVYAKFNYHVSFQVGNQFDEHTRSDLTKIHLHTAVCSPDRFDRFVLLSATVNEAFGAINPQSPWRPLLFSSNAIPFDKISLLGQQINADSMTFRKLGCNGTFDATPIINGLTNYVFNVSIAAHKIVNLTWSFHQMFQIESNTPPTRAGLQAKFDAGSVILGTDDDVKTPDSDPSVAYSTNASSPYRTDDVPVYVEFKISDGPTNLSYFTRTLRPVFPIDFGPSRYFNIVSMEDLDQLLNWTGANLKLVKKIMIPGIGTGNGVAKQGVKPASIVLAESATDVTCIHEWGHSCGLYHRASTDTNGVPLNPGPTLNAIMGPPTLVIDRKEVNRFERDAMNNY